DTKSFAEDKKLSIQMAARTLRYDWFFELLETENFDYLVTAHHLDDDLETFLINTTRATGLKGLTGIPEHTPKIVRPLLIFSKEAIEAYALQNKLQWREDSSNKEVKYLRNKIRLEVIPKMKEAEPALLENFQNTQKYLKQSQQLVEDYMMLVYKQIVTKSPVGYEINITKLENFPHTEALLYELLHSFGFTAWQDIYNLLTAQTGKKVFSPTHGLLKNRDTLLLHKIQVPQKTVYFVSEIPVHVKSPIGLKFQSTKTLGKTTGKTIYVDVQALTFPLEIRKWKAGDVFHPSGMQGKKKLSKFFKDEKLSLLAKQKAWLLCSQNEIVWVIGYRADRRFQADLESKKIIKISCHNE
ncbi:MAG TPA: tRNA lysidine(34) synthetase TilS, partial [Flavobacteriaceae bacterium]|nr:tRNA lysidine(34) synthetase TilS [Flavobacteriaceae bacterium]